MANLVRSPRMAGALVRKARLAHGWTQKELAARMNVRQATISKLESGKPATRLAVLFGVVFLHELGHSLVARRFGIRIFDITFWPLGGMARMSEIPERPATEMWIAFAGPLVNFVLALLTLPVAAWAFLQSAEPGASAGLASRSGAAPSGPRPERGR